MPAEQLTKLSEGSERFQFNAVEGIAGGIRTPHIHLGDEVVLIDKAQFRNVLGEVARNIAQQKVDSAEDYVGMVKQFCLTEICPLHE